MGDDRLDGGADDDFFCSVVKGMTSLSIDQEVEETKLLTSQKVMTNQQLALSFPALLPA